ncbi:MAG TPA: ribonuclease R [Candidatus Paceibacterota bacterium]|nr:ribonuclease R [Candidatus Paceibacterota bacterium]
MSRGTKRGASKVPKKRIEGVISVNRRGIGYLAFDPTAVKGTPKTTEDIEVSTDVLKGALNGDTVEVELTDLFPRPKGKVVKIVERAKEEFICTLTNKNGTLVAIPADLRFYKPITLMDASKYAEGEKVLVRLISFDGKNDPTGTIVEHLGRSGEHRVEMNAIVMEHGFSTSFPPEVEREAQQIEDNYATIIAEEIPKRMDFRESTTFTIDPKDAKDFDDALSVEALPNGEFEIGVHIADATFFCVPGTAIDDEAVKRGTSVYLVDATIPMLPHQLSGNVCSLKADEDRLAFSAIFRINKNGEVLERKFAKTVIRSNKRFTYEDAQEILNRQSGEYITELNILRDLSRTMRTKREKAGAIDFGDNEVRFTLDENGKPVGIVRKERIETNLLIEEFMLLCNREVSLYVSTLAKKLPEKNYTFLYRIHDTPKEDRVEELTTFVRAMGYDFAHNKKKPSAKDIQGLLKQIEGKPEEHLIRTATLRSMAKAVYSTKNIGHFGLSFEYYTHFTSPIRRYPDMLAHRILASHLNGKPITKHEFSNLEKMCLTASAQEARAVDAERESIRYKQVEYMLDKIGQTFDGTISGVTDWGLYVEEKVSAAEGLVRVRTIGNDFYNYSQKEYALVGQRTKIKYTLGDTVRVKLVAADLAARTLDFELAR